MSPLSDEASRHSSGRASAAIAQMLRDRRIELNLTLREVQKRTESVGRPIPFTTIAKIESGLVDPGLKRLHVLFRLYDLPPGLAAELLDLEEFAGELPAASSAGELLAAGVEHWKAGRPRQALAHLFALRARVPESPAGRAERQQALLHFAVAVAQMGKFHLSRLLIDGLILEGPDPILLVPVLVQSASCWHSLGSSEMALALLDRAATHTGAQDHGNRAWLWHLRSAVLVARRDLDAADAALEEAAAAYREAGDAFGEIKLAALAFELRMAREDPRGALAVATRARERAEAAEYKRLQVMRRIEEGRALAALGDHEASLGRLHEALAQAIGMQDAAMQFHAHFHLWKVHVRRGDAAAAALELHAAQYHLRGIDEQPPEAAEVRALSLPGSKGSRRAATR
jgi:transcriptional regulator with XRE-family HTH domain